MRLPSKRCVWPQFRAAWRTMGASPSAQGHFTSLTVNGNPYENNCSPPNSNVSCGLSPRSGFYNRHFSPVSPETDAGFTELGAFGGNRTTINSDYFFPDIKAGNDIAVYHVPTTLPETFGSVITLTLSRCPLSHSRRDW